MIQLVAFYLFATLAIVSSHDGPRTAVSPPGPSDLLPGRLRRRDAPEPTRAASPPPPAAASWPSHERGIHVCRRKLPLITDP